MNILTRKKNTLAPRMLSFFMVLSVALILLLPFGSINANQHGTGAGTPNTGYGTPNSNTGTPNPKAGTPIKINSGIKNPLGSTIVDIPSFIVTILNFVFLIGVPIIALAIIYSGFLFVTAQGNSEKLTKAKQTLLYTIIGAAILLGSFVIANAIKGTVEEIKSST